MNPLGIMISAFAGFLRREARIRLGEIINVIHEVTFTQMGIQIDNHLFLLGRPLKKAHLLRCA